MFARRVIVEELLAGAGGGVPDDYKFFVFHGRCAFVQVDTGRFGASHAGLLPTGLEARATEWRTAVGSSGAAEALPTCRDDRGG